ncbi:hypothetical protein F7725_021560 [Dissostichus mawsoni]|uniref:SPRY-associated domain-containing protein n=1 Tax=Dissostichus mawsoni TaxID=36200 RepID=A0A7J5ZDG7_DISMA|nr:hypothetical protein F7725_021560 [Dissostichus mawsoni]
MMIQQNDAVDVTLDAHTAYTKLVVSEDGKQLRFDEGLPPPDPFSPQKGFQYQPLSLGLRASPLAGSTTKFRSVGLDVGYWEWAKSPSARFTMYSWRDKEGWETSRGRALNRPDVTASARAVGKPPVEERAQTERRERETGERDRRQRDRYEAGRQAPIESVSSQLTVCWATVDKSRHLTAAE